MEVKKVMRMATTVYTNHFGSVTASSEMSILTVYLQTLFPWCACKKNEMNNGTHQISTC